MYLLAIAALVMSSFAAAAAVSPGKWQARNASGLTWLLDATARVDTSRGAFALADPRYEVAVTSEPASDAFGNHPWTVLSAVDTRGELDMVLRFRQDKIGRVLARLSCRNRSSESLRMDNLVVVSGFIPGRWNGGHALQFVTHGIERLQDGVTLGGGHATAVNRPAFAGAFLSNKRYFGLVRVTPRPGGLYLEAVNSAGGVLLPPGKQRDSETVWLSPGKDPSAELERWAELAGKWNRVRIWPRNMATWCSWYSGITFSQCLGGRLERDTLANVPILVEKFLPLGLECARVVDDSIKRGAGDWPLATDALPGGYEALASAMRSAGLRPGFWYDNNRVLADSQLFARHADWLVRGPDGLPATADPSNPYGPYAWLDPSVPEARDYYYECARKFSGAGLRYCFTDFTGESIVGPDRSRNPEITGPEVSRRALEAVRKGFGNDFYWLSQQTFVGTYGLVDAMRTGSDSFGDNVESYREALTKWFMNRRLFLCDPDAWCPLRHAEQWDRDWGSWQALTGYAVTIGGDMRGLTPQREGTILRILPPLNSTGRPRDLWERRLPVVLEQQMAVGGETWRVVGLFNWHEYPVNVKLNLDRLWDESEFDKPGFPEDAGKLGTTAARYLLYDFWPESMIGVFDGVFDLPLPAGSGRVICIRPAQNRPQLLSVGSHIGQGSEELVSCSWNAGPMTLTGATRGLRGVRDTTLRLRVPEGWAVDSVSAGGRELEWDAPQDGVCRFTVPDRHGLTRWRVKFSGGAAVGSLIERSVNPGLIADVAICPDAADKIMGSTLTAAETKLGARAESVIPEGYRLKFYANAAGVTGEAYDPALGFGVVSGSTFRSWDPSTRVWGTLNWYGAPRIAYRIDRLPADRRYRLGVSLFDHDSRARRVDIAVIRLRDRAEFLLAEDVVEPSLLDKQPAATTWYDLPEDAVDPAGIVVEIRRKSGANAVCGEIWVIGTD